MFRDLYRSAPHRAKPMTRPILTAAALLALATPAMAENPIGRFARVYDRAHLTHASGSTRQGG